MTNIFARYTGLVLVVFCLGLASSCTKDYVTGKQTFSVVSEDSELEMGAEYDPVLVAEFGLYDDQALADYIDHLGQSLAAVSHRTNLDYTFRLLDTPVLNAFAVPGGYVYVTRGILAYMNSEDELAGVMGHEVGHVAARHSAKQMSKGVVASGFGLFTAISRVLPRVGSILLMPGELLLLKYSRSDEIQADRLGVEYATKLGYNARDMSNFFQTLDRMAAGEEQTPGFLSTHPNPGDRYTKVNELTTEWQEKIDYQPLNLDPDDFLRRIDGIVYGGDPRQGFVDGNMFYHPELGFQIPIPSKWKVANAATYILIVSEKEDAYVQLSLGEASSPAEAADAFMEEGGIQLIRREPGFVNGLPAELVESMAGSGSDQIRILSYFIAKDDHVYVLHGVTATALYPGYVSKFVHTMEGFESVTDPAILSISPRRVRVKPAPRDGRFDEVARALGVSKDDMDDVVSMNGRLPDDEVRRGDLIKIIE